MASIKPMTAQGFNEGTALPNTAEDVRFTVKGDVVYAIVLGRPEGEVVLRTFAASERPVSGVEMLGGNGPLEFSLGEGGLTIIPELGSGNETATVFRINLG